MKSPFNRLRSFPVLLLLALARLHAVAADDPKNILLIIGDDHSLEAYGAYGAPKARTPNLDRLAAEGMRFANAFTNSPAGQNSRLSMLAGRLPHTIGVTQHDYREKRSELDKPTTGDWNNDCVTIAHLLAFSGFGTFASGSMYFPNEEARYGYNQTYTFLDAQNQIFARPMRAAPEGLPAQVPTWRVFLEATRIWLDSANLPMPYYAEDMPVTEFINHADDFIRKQAGKPFFCTVAFMEPHAPFAYPIEMAGLFRAEDFNAPAPGPEDVDEIPQVFLGLTQAEKNGTLAAYHTAANYLDNSVGELLKRLDNAGVADRTVVIYLSDSGYMLGQHGWFEKHCLYDPAVRVPLVVRWPGVTKPGSTCDEFVELVDILPTIAQLAGVRIPVWAEGRSLVPLLRGEAGAGRSSVFAEFLDNQEAMLRDARYKLIYTRGKMERRDGFMADAFREGRKIKLFDLQQDPGETKNVAGDTVHRDRIEAMKKEMLARFALSLPGGIGLPDDAPIEDKLDLLLIPREWWQHAEALIRQKL